MGKKLVVCVAIAAILTATGCGGSDSTPKSLLSKPTGAKLAADFGGSGPATLTAAFAIQDLDFDLRDASNLAARITYMSTSGIDNSLVPVTGAVFVPWGSPPSRDGWPAVALGHATTGVKPECAPSLSRNISNLAPTIVELLKAGFVVTVPDYQGLGSERSFHPYLDATTVGYNLIDSVRAARKLVRNMSDRWVAIGTDQGGQAAWAANELAGTYGGGLHLMGSISLAPFTDLGELADTAAAGALTKEQKLQLQAYLVALKNEHSDFDLDAFRHGIVTEKWEVLSACQGAELKERDQIAGQIGADDLRPANAVSVQTLRQFLQKDSLPQKRAVAPMWVIYGGQDPFTPPAWTERALKQACGLGDTIRIEKQPDIRPDRIDVARAMPWITSQFLAESPVDDCTTFTEPPPSTDESYDASSDESYNESEDG